MNDSHPTSLPKDFRRSGHGRLLVLVAVIMLAVPLILITYLVTMTYDEREFIGCRGTISINGQPLTSGQVITRNADARSGESNSSGTINAEGEFQLATDGQPGARTGHHHLAVVSDAKIGGVELPEKYRTLKTTPLTIDIQPEPRFNFFTLDIKVDD